MTELDAFMILNAVPGVGASRLRRLVEYFGDAGRVLTASRQELASLGILPENVIENILDFSKDKFLKNEYNLMQQCRARAVHCFNSEYPGILKEIPDYPAVLYVKGDWPKEPVLCLAVVGSRRASVYGRKIAGRFAQRLSDCGFVIVSGMARGIDTAAHQGSLSAGGQTIAVLGSGLAEIYPPENRNLAEEISSRGAVISEFPMSMPPLAQNFPARNRIISGLSRGVLVVEAALRSGALITARCAGEQGRDVFAIPGNIDSPSSRGAHALIRDGAKLVEREEDILEEMALPIAETLNARQMSEAGGCKSQASALPTAGRTLEAEEVLLMKCINERPVHVDELTARTGFAPAKIFSLLTQLQLKRLVKERPGKHFTKQKEDYG